MIYQFIDGVSHAFGIDTFSGAWSHANVFFASLTISPIYAYLTVGCTPERATSNQQPDTPYLSRATAV